MEYYKDCCVKIHIMEGKDFSSEETTAVVCALHNDVDQFDVFTI